MARSSVVEMVYPMILYGARGFEGKEDCGAVRARRPWCTVQMSDQNRVVAHTFWGSRINPIDWRSPSNFINSYPDTSVHFGVEVELALAGALLSMFSHMSIASLAGKGH